MKKAIYRKTISKVITMALILAFATGCTKKDPPNMAPDNWLERSYLGVLTINYTSVYPEWNVSATMDVTIDKEMGDVMVSSTTLNYSGETIIDEDGKIERTGSWELVPTGRLEGTWEDRYVFIDAGIIIQNDVQKIYAKDDQGNWQLVSTVDFSGAEPNSDLTFDFDEANSSGSVISVASAAGSITWTLHLMPALD
ncbi:MAG: hypothetical protein JXB00_12505 [Bacteroidales bacterium]|nr:hypothetical protein [Bacteroidales bacterium]